MQIHWLRMFTRLRHWAGLILLEVVKSTKACSGLAVAVMTCVGLDPRSFAAEFQFSCSISPLNAEQQGMSDWETLFFAHNRMNCLMVQTFMSNTAASNFAKTFMIHEFHCWRFTRLMLYIYIYIHTSVWSVFPFALWLTDTGNNLGQYYFRKTVKRCVSTLHVECSANRENKLRMISTALSSMFTSPPMFLVCAYKSTIYEVQKGAVYPALSFFVSHNRITLILVILKICSLPICFSFPTSLFTSIHLADAMWHFHRLWQNTQRLATLHLT